MVEIRKGAANTTVTRSSATSVSASQISFVPTLNNLSTIIDPYVYVEIPLTVTVNAANPIGPVAMQQYVQNFFAPRQYPLNSCINTATVQINNVSVTSNPSQFVHQLAAFQPYDGKEGQALIQSLVPIQPDTSPQYADSAGSLKSPLNWYFTGGEHYSESRGSFVSNFVTIANTPSQWQFTYLLREPIMNPLLDYDPNKKREGLAYVNQMIINLTLASNLSRMFSCDLVNCPNVASVNVSFNTASLVMTWLTAAQAQSLPPTVLKSFNNIIANQTVVPSMASGQQLTIQSQSWTMSQIPRKIWVYVAPSTGSLDTPTGFGQSDYNFSIQQVSVLFNNKSSLMANMGPGDLYNACMASEGCIKSYTESQNYWGSCLILDPALLFGLQDDEAPGVLGNYQLQIQVQCTNISQSTVATPVLYVVWAMENIMVTDSNANTTLSQGFVTQEDVVASNRLPARPASFGEADIYGGSFFDTLKRALGTVYNFAKDNRLVSKGLASFPQTAPYAPIAEQLGFGRTSRQQMRRQYTSLRN